VATGKRAGARAKRTFRPVLLGLAVGVTVALVAWGYLVWAAIDFGAAARNGDETAWWFLGLAASGAMVCLFLALVLVARISRALGITRAPEQRTAPPPTPGGRRSSR
jgi:RsiW-degrading membrane proteinase PrsW (M82 family)